MLLIVPAGDSFNTVLCVLSGLFVDHFFVLGCADAGKLAHLAIRATMVFRSTMNEVATMGTERRCLENQDLHRLMTAGQLMALELRRLNGELPSAAGGHGSIYTAAVSAAGHS